MAEQTLNIPQIIVFIAVTVLIVRWFLKPSAAGQPSSASNRAARINPAQIDHLVQMFPQLDRRTVAWNLNRAGGNAQAITETLLAGGTLQQVRTQISGQKFRSTTVERRHVANTHTASGILPAPAFADSDTHRPSSPPAREARAAGPYHTIQPCLQGRAGRRVERSGNTKGKGVVAGQERAAGKPPATERRDDSGRETEAGGEGKGRAEDGMSNGEQMFLRAYVNPAICAGDAGNRVVGFDVLGVSVYSRQHIKSEAEPP